MQTKVVACIGAELYAFKKCCYFFKTWHITFNSALKAAMSKTFCVYLDRENKDNENDTKARILTDKLYIICMIKQEQINPKITKKSGKIIVLKEY